MLELPSLNLPWNTSPNSASIYLIVAVKLHCVDDW